MSKGPNGDRLVFPSERFIGTLTLVLTFKFQSLESLNAPFAYPLAGENYVDQLRVLALLGTNDGLMIAHGGWVSLTDKLTMS